MLLFGGLLRSLAALLLVAGFLALVLFYPYVIVATLYLIPILVTKLMTENLYTLKARMMQTNVYQLKKEETSDDFFDDRGRINRQEENGGKNEKE